MGAGALRSFNQATALYNMPVNLVGVAISTAFFPQLTEELGKGDKEQFYATFRKALRTIIWISLPVAAVSFFARGYVVNFIKNGGDMRIASILATMIVAIFARSVFHIASRGFYAYQDTKTPFVVSIVAIGLTILLSIIFFLLDLDVEGLGWAQSIGAIVEIFILIYILQVRSKYKILNKKFFEGFGKMLFATLITSCVAYSMTKFLPLMATDNSFLQTFPKFCVIALSSIFAYVLASYFLGLSEVQPVFEKIKKILFRNIK